MIVDNLITFKILWMIVTPFKDTKAFEYGIVDEQGKLLKKVDQLRTMEEKDAYSPLVRLVFNIKRLIGKLPGGENKIKNIAAAYFLVKENVLCDDFDHITENYVKELSNYVLIEETLTVLNFLKIFEDAPANATGAAVSTDEPVIRKKKRIPMFKRSMLVGVV